MNFAVVKVLFFMTRKKNKEKSYQIETIHRIIQRMQGRGLRDPGAETVLPYHRKVM